ncbi:MAG: alpha/beta hydrolase [Ferruginibacter sp.]
MKRIIYCISGLGADERAFSKLQIHNAELITLRWLPPEKNEPIEKYALRMAANIQHPEPILLGLSFGGMMSIEIAALIPVKAVILISSIKSAAELPAWMRLAGIVRINKLFPIKSARFMEPVTNRTLGVTTAEEKTMVREFRKNSPVKYNNWAVDKILNWKKKHVLNNVFHIHGNKDRIFPIKKTTATHIIDGGKHLMIMSKHEEVSACINQILQSI